MEEKRCGQCAHFIGAGDWDLCCGRGVRRLTYEKDTACDGFEQNPVCMNVSATVGGFFCLSCGLEAWDRGVRDMRCPGCGKAIEGALFGGSLGWRG